jgi:hypothetical protein
MVNFLIAAKISVETFIETVVENCRAFRVNRARLEELRAVLAGGVLLAQTTLKLSAFDHCLPADA